ncbi:Cytochrome P450 [Phytophthora palmivora]|uniref:Cytochrome P450 n=1 Tax=Phytophthora palmivora TaxID=4796 RepID=A0A2P4X9S5_9STRA|nr:Cytochrome P450 [Phytophthora palmivora]
MKRVDDVIYQVISHSMESKSEVNPQRLPDLISLFLAKETNEYRERDASQDDGAVATRSVKTTPKLIRDMAFNFTAAGRGTTSQSLQWIFIMLNRYPHVEARIREELLAKLPQLFAKDSIPPSMNDVQQLVYLEAVIKESLRLNPVAPLIGRTATQDVFLSDGTFVPSGTRVVIPTFAVARLQSIWGEDAAEFKPDRWIDPESGKVLIISPFKFLVFLAGPRSCLGAKLAMLELKVALATVLSKFHLRVLRNPFEIGYDASISLPVKGDVLAAVEAVEVPSLCEPAKLAGAA